MLKNIKLACLLINFSFFSLSEEPSSEYFPYKRLIDSSCQYASHGGIHGSHHVSFPFAEGRLTVL